MQKKKLYIKSYGCQMNVYDAQKIEEDFKGLNFEITDDFKAADVAILNTCHIRENASEKVYSHLGVLNKLKRERQTDGAGELLVGVVGCVAQAQGEQMFKRAPFIDFVLGPQSYHKIPSILKKIEEDPTAPRKHFCLDFAAQNKFEHAQEVLMRQKQQTPSPSAFLTIQEGCDKFCTFCVVPYTRGAEMSRSVADILKEAQLLVDRGVREITLLGQNVNAYHGESLHKKGEASNLAQLMEELSQIEGLERLFYTTSHPIDMTLDLIEAHARLPKVMPYLHLPIQSGSNAVLKRMNRYHSVEDYLRMVALLRKARPDIALSSDFIVGFPGETDEEFEATMHLVEEVKFAKAYSFKYSPRPGTPSAALLEKNEDMRVNEELASQRLARLQDMLKAQQMAFNQSFEGKKLSLLCERIDPKAGGTLVGKTPYMQTAYVSANGAGTSVGTSSESYVGQMLEFRVERAGLNGVHGVLEVSNPQKQPKAFLAANAI